VTVQSANIPDVLPILPVDDTFSRTYLDWLLDLPWNTSTPDNLELARGRTVLDEDHYDLEQIKDRIIEYLAVRKLHQEQGDAQARGPILCFVGPPGVGKTSLGQSIARALGRKFVRVALSGVRDDPRDPGARNHVDHQRPTAAGPAGSVSAQPENSHCRPRCHPGRWHGNRSGRPTAGIDRVKWLLHRVPYRGRRPMNCVTWRSHSRVSSSRVVGCSPMMLTSTCPPAPSNPITCGPRCRTVSPNSPLKNCSATASAASGASVVVVS